MIYIVALLAFVSTLLGGLFAIRFRDKLHLILGFSAGAVLAVALFDLLPEAIDLASKDHAVSTITLFTAAGFAVYLLFDRFFSLHTHDDEHCENPQHKRGNFGAATLSLHSFLDGVGIGLAFKVSASVGWVVTAAVLTHDFSDGINTVNMILKNSGERTKALRWLIADALAPALGIAATSFIAISEPVLGLVLATFAGFFLYIGASDLIPESHHRHPTIWTTIMTILGILVLFVAIRLAG